MPLRKNAKVELIKSVPLFSSCSKKELAAIAAQADELVVPEGKTLTKQATVAASSWSSSTARPRCARTA